QQLELPHRPPPALLGRRRARGPILGLRELAPIARQSPEHQVVVAGNVEHELPDAMRTSDGMAGRLRRGDAGQQFEHRGPVPRLALEGSPELILESATFAAHSASPPPPQPTPAGSRASGRRASRVPRTTSGRGPRSWDARRTRTRRPIPAPPTPSGASRRR